MLNRIVIDPIFHRKCFMIFLWKWIWVIIGCHINFRENATDFDNKRTRFVIIKLTSHLTLLSLRIKCHLVNGFVLCFCRYSVQARGVINTVSHSSVLYAIRTCCNNENNSRPHRLLLQIVDCHRCNHCCTANRISNRVTQRGQGFSTSMRVFGDFIPPHWHDPIEWRNVSGIRNTNIYRLILLWNMILACVIGPLITFADFYQCSESFWNVHFIVDSTTYYLHKDSLRLRYGCCRIFWCSLRVS